MKTLINLMDNGGGCGGQERGSYTLRMKHSNFVNGHVYYDKKEDLVVYILRRRVFFAKSYA